MVKTGFRVTDTYTTTIPDRICLLCSRSRSPSRFPGSSSRSISLPPTYTHPPCIRISGHHCIVSLSGTTDGDISPNLQSLVFRRKVAGHGWKERAVVKPLWSHDGNPCLTSLYHIQMHFPLSALLL